MNKKRAPNASQREQRTQHDRLSAALRGEPAPPASSRTVVTDWANSLFKRDRIKRPGGKKPRQPRRTP